VSKRTVKWLFVRRRGREREKEEVSSGGGRSAGDWSVGPSFGRSVAWSDGQSEDRSWRDVKSDSLCQID
jgi:hypothetical protein